MNELGADGDGQRHVDGAAVAQAIAHAALVHRAALRVAETPCRWGPRSAAAASATGRSCHAHPLSRTHPPRQPAPPPITHLAAHAVGVQLCGAAGAGEVDKPAGAAAHAAGIQHARAAAGAGDVQHSASGAAGAQGGDQA